MVTVEVVKPKVKALVSMTDMPVGSFGVIEDTTHQSYLRVTVFKTKDRKIVNIQNPTMQWDECSTSNLVRIATNVEIKLTLE